MPRLLSFCVALLALSFASPVEAGFVNRPLRTVAKAIGITQPGLSLRTRKGWAKILIRTAKKNNFDPFTGVAIIAHESHWRPSVISRDGEDFGFGQVRARYAAGCDSSIPAAQDNSASCNAVKARLLSPAFGIRRMGRAITAWRKKCRQVTRRPALFKRWLHGYGGMGKLDKRTGRWKHLCGMKRVGRGWRDLPLRKELREIINHRRMLIRRLRRG